MLMYTVYALHKPTNDTRRSSVNFGGKTCKRTINSPLEPGWMVIADGLIGSTCVNVFHIFQRQAPACVGCNKVLQADVAKCEFCALRSTP